MHCPHCGEPTPAAATVCPRCGHALDPPPNGSGKPMARTMVGIPPAMAAAARDAEAAAKTIVGMRPPAAVTSKPAEPEAPGGFDGQLRTQVGFRPPAANLPPAPSPPGSQPAAPLKSARPERGTQDPPRSEPAAPPRSARLPESAVPSSKHAPQSYAPIDELGATVAPPIAMKPEPAKRLKAHALNAPRLAIPPLKPPKVHSSAKPSKARGSRAPIALMITAGVIVSGAITFAILWSGRSPLAARVRLNAQGAEVVELSCPSCPDGTTLSAGQASATVSGGVAALAPDKPLSPGENRFKVKIDRPGGGRDESVFISAAVAYRIRPDLSALQAEKPAIQVVIEAAKGAQVKLDGRTIPLYAGRATESFDVTEACSGLAADATSLTRQIPYTVTTSDGEERGSVNVVVGVVPLELDAPGPNAVIDGPSFVIAGRTMKGADLLAAGKPIPVKPDGSFAHVMNVSSVGSTQIEVRAKVAGMAPRITKIKVRRVDSLETAAKDFAAEAPIPFAALSPSVNQQAGKAIVVSGQVLDVQHEGRRTVMILDVSASGGCAGCSARLIQGAETTTQTGDTITAYGHVLRAVRIPERGEIPEIQVDFTLKGKR